jgi:hypothetical protein
VAIRIRARMIRPLSNCAAIGVIVILPHSGAVPRALGPKSAPSVPWSGQPWRLPGRTAPP